MYNVICTGKSRKVFHANFNHHRKGELHPDRIIDSHDLVYILEGNWSIGQDGVNYYIEQGDVIILQAGHHHYGINRNLPGVKTMFIHIEYFTEEKLINDPDEIILPENTLVLPVVIKCHDSVSVISLFEDIIYTFWSDLPNKGIKLSALSDLLLFELAESGRNNKDVYSKLVNDALHLIRMTPHKIFTLSELSEILNVCSRTLTAKFKKGTGKSVHQYQLDLKLEMAYMMIRDNPERPFKEVALNFGFYDEFHLSKLFKRRYGYPPANLKNGRQIDHYSPI